MIFEIDDSSGFCWGVVRTIDKVEKSLNEYPDRQIYVLGQIIHNPREIERLGQRGLKTISHEDFDTLNGKKNIKVIIRAHGEPPSTYLKAAAMEIGLIDATCPLVRNLQSRVRRACVDGYSIVIFGKQEHPEVIGLRGVCNDDCIVVRSVDEALSKVNFDRKTLLVSQTTMDKPTFIAIAEALKNKLKGLGLPDADDFFEVQNTICKFVTRREASLRAFAQKNDVVLFVAGRNSSNGKSLFITATEANPRSYFIEDIKEIDYNWFDGAEKIGITGATSTPQWYMQQIRDALDAKYNS